MSQPSYSNWSIVLGEGKKKEKGEPKEKNSFSILLLSEAQSSLCWLSHHAPTHYSYSSFPKFHSHTPFLVIVMPLLKAEVAKACESPLPTASQPSSVPAEVNDGLLLLPTLCHRSESWIRLSFSLLPQIYSTLFPPAWSLVEPVQPGPRQDTLTSEHSRHARRCRRSFGTVSKAILSQRRATKE